MEKNVENIAIQIQNPSLQNGHLVEDTGKKRRRTRMGNLWECYIDKNDRHLWLVLALLQGHQDFIDAFFEKEILTYEYEARVFNSMQNIALQLGYKCVRRRGRHIRGYIQIKKHRYKQCQKCRDSLRKQFPKVEID